MRNRYGRRVGGESLDSFNDYDRAPSKFAAHKGLCACGVETSRMGYSSADPWVCHECSEKAIRAIFDRAMKTKP